MASYHDTHREGIGCSEVATILGLDHRASPLELWAIKRGLVTPDDDGDASTERGNAYEPAVLAWASQRLGRPLLIQGKDYEVPMRRGRLLGSPDALDGFKATADFGVEAKTRQFAFGWGEDGSDDVPVLEALQCHGYMALTGLPAWYVAVGFGMPFELRLYRLVRDEQRCQRILAFVERWWTRHVEGGEAPAAVTPEDHSRRARLLHPEAGTELLRCESPEVVALMEELRDAERTYLSAKRQAKAAEDRRRIARGRIESLIGDAAGIETPVGVARLKTRGPRGRLSTRWFGFQENDDGDGDGNED